MKRRPRIPLDLEDMMDVLLALSLAKKEYQAELEVVSNPEERANLEHKYARAEAIQTRISKYVRKVVIW